MAGLQWIQLAILMVISSAFLDPTQAFPTTSAEDHQSPQVSPITSSASSLTNETTAALSITPPAAEEKEDGPAATDEEDGKEEEEVEAVQQLPRQVVRILPPVEMMVENEIWQYRYPPFDDIFNIKPSDEDLHDDGRLGRLEHQDVLPSYVIGILDPAELVEGLFSSSQRASASSSSSSAEGGSRNSVSTPIEFPGPVNPADEHIIRIGKSLISHQDDDRWVWPTVS